MKLVNCLTSSMPYKIIGGGLDIFLGFVTTVWFFTSLVHSSSSVSKQKLLLVSTIAVSTYFLGAVYIEQLMLIVVVGSSGERSLYWFSPRTLCQGILMSFSNVSLLRLYNRLLVFDGRVFITYLFLVILHFEYFQLNCFLHVEPY